MSQVFEHPATPRFAPRKFIIPQQRSINSNYLSRTRSDTTTTTTSSSSEDEPNEEPSHHHKPYSSSTTAAPLTFDHYNASNNTNNANNSSLFHRYNKTTEYKSLSSPRLRVCKILFLDFFFFTKV